MQPIQTFLLTPTTQTKLDLRRYRASSLPDSLCPAIPGNWATHDAKIHFDVVENTVDYKSLEPARDDSRWPTHCQCGFAFKEEDAWQLFNEPLYTRSDTGEKTTRRDAPLGAMWYATWYHDDRKSLDGRQIYGFYWENQFEPCLVVKTPGGDWDIDARASNCTMPQDRQHRCWVRHGEPPVIHVDKAGFTCNAGAGSIMIGNWHGFLRNGFLVE